MVDTNSYITEYERTIRSNIQPRNILIQRASPGSSFTNVSSRSVVARSVGSVYGATGAAGNAATSVTDQRKSERRDMQDLNERFAGYIEKVRFLEAQNRKLSDELETLKSRWGKQTTIIKTMYQTDLEQVKRLLDDCEKETQRLQIQVASMEEKVDDLRRKLDEANAAVDESRDKMEKQIQQIAEIQSEVHLLRLRSELLDGDKKYNKAILTRLQENLNRARSDFDAQAAEHDAAEARALALEEELAFTKEIHEQELRELASKAYFDSTSTNREYWKSEMSAEMKRLQEQYSEKLEDLQNEMTLSYNVMVQSLNLPRPVAAVATNKEETVRIRTQTNEIRSKVMELEGRNDMLMREIDEMKRDMEERENEVMKELDVTRSDIVTMKAEMEAISRELEALLDAKLSLELEIATYKKLLEGEENGEGLKQVVDSMFDAYASATSTAASAYESAYAEGFNNAPVAFSSNTSLSRKITGSTNLVGGRTSYQRNARGPVSISECSPDGKFIVLENTGKRREELGGFTLRRNVDGRDMPVYTFRADAGIEPKMKIKLWVKGSKPLNSSASDIEVDIADWGTGQNITTQLFNSSGQDRASHTQKTLA